MRQWFFLSSFCVMLPSMLVAAPALRLVSLLPSNSEIVEALGEGQEIVGVTVFEKGAAARGRQSVGDFINPSIETIVALKPDLVLAGDWKNSRAVPTLRHLGFTVLEVPNPRSMNALYESITRIATAIHRESAANAVIKNLKDHLERLERQAPHPAFPTYIEIDAAYWTVGGHDFLSEALCDIGACNVFADLPDAAGQVSSEAVLMRAPQLILTLTGTRQSIRSRPGWSDVPAVKASRIIDDVSADLLTHPSPALFEGLDAVAERLEIYSRRTRQQP